MSSPENNLQEGEKEEQKKVRNSAEVQAQERQDQEIEDFIADIKNKIEASSNTNKNTSPTIVNAKKIPRLNRELLKSRIKKEKETLARNVETLDELRVHDT
jgi:hypothetical protein